MGGIGRGCDSDGEWGLFVTENFSAEIGEPVAVSVLLKPVAAAPSGIEQSDSSAGICLIPILFFAAWENSAERFPVQQISTRSELGGVTLGFVFKLDVNHVPLVAVAENVGAIDFPARRGFQNDAVFERGFDFVEDGLHLLLRNSIDIRIGSGSREECPTEQQ